MNAPHVRSPALLSPITDIHSVETSACAEPAPFFGFAPSETSVRLVTCPECGQSVSAAHVERHIESAHRAAAAGGRAQMQMQTESVLLPPQRCFFAQREEYTFQRLFESEK